MNLEPLATTMIGSMPRPSWMGETDRNRVTFRLAGRGAATRRRTTPPS